MSGDWVRLHRKIIFSQAWCSEGLLMVWIWCLLRANWRETWVPVTTGRGTTEVKLQAGQFIFGRKTAAKELRMKPSTVRDRMHRLAKMGNITMQADTHYTVVSVSNWETYQCSNVGEADTQPATQPPGNQQATATHPTQSKKDKNKQDGKEQPEASASCSKPPSGDPEPTPVLVYPCNGKPKTFGLTQTKIDEYAESYPAVDVPAECRSILQWCRDNPTKRKTARGMPACINRWLQKEQNKGGKTLFGQNGPVAEKDIPRFSDRKT